MPRERPASPLVARQRRAAERLRREVAAVDGSGRHPYFRELERQLRTHRREVSQDELVDACAQADVVWIGDYHALPACQRFAGDLLAGLARRVRRLALGVEFVFTRQQRILDRRQAGLLDDPTFLRRIHYRDEWGYPWEGFRALLDVARDSRLPVYALDSPPRGGYDGLGRRDRHAAARIAELLGEDPGRRLLVLFGESHVTRSHLPRQLETTLRRRGTEARQVVVFQNPDRIYWERIGRGEPVDRPVEVGGGVYAVFHAGPLEKYEAYRQVLARWRDDVPADEEVDLTPAVHHLIAVLLGWLGIRPHRYRLRHRAGWGQDLADALPEVYSGPEARDLLPQILRETSRTDEEIEEARRRLETRQALFDPRSNTLFLTRYLPGSAAGEAARFLRAALTGRLFIVTDDFRADPVARAYGAAYNEALAFLGSRLADPGSSYPLAPRDPPGERPEANAGEPGAEFVCWFEAHHAFEMSRRIRLPESLALPLRSSRPLRRQLADDLGPRLGRVLFERVRRGELSTRQLRQLFTRPLLPERAPRFVLRLLRGLPRRRSAAGGQKEGAAPGGAAR